MNFHGNSSIVYWLFISYCVTLIHHMCSVYHFVIFNQILFHNWHEIFLWHIVVVYVCMFVSFSLQVELMVCLLKQNLYCGQFHSHLIRWRIKFNEMLLWCYCVCVCVNNKWCGAKMQITLPLFDDDIRISLLFHRHQKKRKKFSSSIWHTHAL